MTQPIRRHSVEPTDSEKLDLVSRVLDLLPDFFYVHDSEMRFRYANQRAADYFGVGDKAALLGRRLEELDRNPEQARAFIEVCQRIMHEGVPRITDNLPYVRGDGTTGYLRQHDIPFINPKTGERMLIGLSRDVTVERELIAQQIRSAQLERELDIARRIQSGLRPAEPPAALGDHVRLAAHAQPAAYAGGDFYDWFATSDGRLVLCLGDVTGHGVGPALLASECRAYARVLLATQPLERAFVELDRMLAADLHDGRFITFAAIVIEPGSFTVQTLSAGHGPLLHVTASGPVELPVQRPPLGIAVDLGEVESCTRHLAPGDHLVLMSDGVFESQGPSGELFGLGRVRSQLAGVHGRSAANAVSDVIGSLASHAAGTPPADDITLVVAAREP